MTEYGLLTRAYIKLFPRKRQVQATTSGQVLSLSRQTSMFGSTEDKDVAEERQRIHNTPLDKLHQTDSIILKVGCYT